MRLHRRALSIQSLMLGASSKTSESQSQLRAPVALRLEARMPSTASKSDLACSRTEGSAEKWICRHVTAGSEDDGLVNEQKARS
jgi:hypothetical protein